VRKSLIIKVLFFVFFAVFAASAVGWLTFYVVDNFL